MFSERCAKCQKQIDGAVFEAMEQKFHLECFTCSAGNHAFSEAATFHVHENKVYCPPHFEELFLQKCKECGKGITGQYTKILDDHFHPECWKCSKCKKNITAESCGQTGGRFYCTSCHADIAGKTAALLAGSAPKTAASTSTPAAAHAPASAPTSTFHPPVQTSKSPPQVDREITKPKPEAKEPVIKDIVIGQFYPYAALKNNEVPPAVDKSRKEHYLSDSDFFKLFRMSKVEFAKHPDWKQKRLKQGLFLF
jgi:hypothetical protein